MLCRILEGGGYAVLEAGNGREAAHQLAQHPYRVDLLITDLVMPEQEGIETIQHLRRKYPHLKIIAISGALDSAYLEVARYLGADRALPKPLRSEVLLGAVHDVLA